MTAIPGLLSTKLLEFGQSRLRYISGTDVASQIAEPASELNADRFVIVSDRRVGPLYGEQYRTALSSLAPTDVVLVGTGEEFKNWETLRHLCESFIRLGATRRTCIVALGGGVIGNLAGLAAALTFRGLRLIHIPTTLVAAFDSVISFKQAINSSAGKNHVGTFHEPAFVFADFAAFETLENRDVLSGVGELIKNVLAIRPNDFDALASRISPSTRLSPEATSWFLEMSVASKLQLMASDPEERRAGIVLEYGHTVGHALEFIDCSRRGSKSLSHGEAVAIGALVAAIVSIDAVGADESLVNHHRYLLDAAGMSNALPDDIGVQEVLNCALRDNKRGYVTSAGDQVPMVLLKSIGYPCWNGDVPLTLVSSRTLGRALRLVENHSLS